jgi:outer membrane protein assembly factor BamB
VEGNFFKGTENYTYFSSYVFSNLSSYNNSDILINKNTFETTDILAIRVGSSVVGDTINAEGNYWGTIEETTIQAMIFDRDDDLATGGYINYSEWLTEPDINTPSIEARAWSVPDDFTTIQSAIDNSFDGDTVLINPGTYYENLYLDRKNLILGSLFITTKDTSYISSTIIDGSLESIQTGMTVLNVDSTTTISGVSIINSGDAGLKIGDNSTPLISNIRIMGSEGNFEGTGGFYIYNSNPTIEDVIVSKNNGYAINCWSSLLEITRSIISNNNSNKGSNDSVIRLNNGCGLTLNSSLISSNESQSSVINIASGDLTILNSTITNNNTFDSGIRVNSGSLVITNSIIFEEKIKNYDLVPVINGTATIKNSILTEAKDSEYSIVGDPLFLDPENGDYRLSDYSPAIGAGDPATATSFDIGGNPRPDPLGTNPDIGAFENKRSEPIQALKPGSLTAIAGNGKVNLSWETSEDVKYNIYRSETDNIDDFELLDYSISSTTYTDSLVSNGTTYYYIVALVIEGDSEIVSASPRVRKIEVYADGSGEYPTIQDAIDNSENTDTVLINPGTYYENITLDGKNIVLGSLYLANKDTSYISSTIIDGGENGTVITLGDNLDSTSVLTGFTIQNGLAKYGAGIVGEYADPTLRNLIIKSNIASEAGGGVYLTQSNSKIIDVLFKNNTAGDDGSAIVYQSSDAFLKNSSFINNETQENGAVIYIYGSTAEIENIFVKDNNGPALSFNSYSSQVDISSKISNSVIIGNRYYLILSNFADLEIDNSTFVFENSFEGEPVNIWSLSESNFEIRNSILYGLGSSNEVQGTSDILSSLDIFNSLTSTGNQYGADNINSDPLFIDPENGDYRLSDYSPAIGAGDPSTSTAFDNEGNSRPNPSGSNPDIGAYENERSEPLGLPAPTNITGSGGEFSITFSWDYDVALQPIAQGYEILRGSQLNNLAVIDSSDTESFVDSTISPGQTYYYAISMYSADGRKSPVSEAFQISSEDNAPVTSSSFGSELTGFKSVRLTWLQNSEADLGGYKIYRGVTGSGSTSLLTEIGIVTTYTDTDNLSNFTNYTYELAAVDTNGNESPRISTSVKTGDEVAPAAPIGVTAEGIPDQVNLNWEPNAEADFWKYRIYRGTSAQNLSLIDSVAKGTTSYSDVEVTNAVRYYYAITAVDSASGQDFDPANESGYSTIVDARPPDLVGPGQSEITTINSSNSTVQLSWEALTDGDLDKYRIYRGVSGNSLTRLDSVNAGTTSYTDNNVSNGVDYRYAVAGVDTLNNEGELSEVKIGAPRNIPPVVTSLSNLDVGSVSEPSREIELSADGSSDEDGTVESYSWLIEGEQVSTQPNYTHAFDQGSSLVELIIEDNDGAQDTASFYVNISSKDRGFGSENADAAGVSLIGFDYLFMPLQGGTMQIIDSKFNDRFDISVGGEIRSVSSIASDTTVYLSSTDRFVYSFDRRGVPEWETPLGGELQATPTIDTNRDRIYVGVSNNNIFAIDRSDGEVAWTYRLSSPITQPGVVVQGRYLLFLTVEGTGAYFDLDAEINNGELRPFGNIDLETNLASSPAIDKEGFIYASTLRGQVRKFVFKEEIDDRTTAVPEVSWSADVSTEFTASPVVGYDGTIYIGGNDSTLYALSGATGEIQWEFATKGSISTTATINAFGVIYIGDSTGRIYAIDETGEQLWYYQAEHPIGNATAYTKGELIFATTNGNIVSIYDGWRFEALKMVADKAPQWGTYQGNFRRTGDLAAEVSTSLEEEDLIPEDFTLSQNYPNPFNPTTKIQYGLPEASKVRLDVFNLLGQRVATLVDEKVKAGMHTVTFDASQLASGIYIYRLATSKAVFTKKLTLIK